MIDNKLVDKIAWWIPNSNLRRTFRDFMNTNINLNNNIPNFFDNDVKAIIKSQFENSITHFSVYTTSNYGDNILVISLRDSIEKILNKSYVWVNKHAYNKFYDEDIQIANQTKCIIIGGGGLFLKDTNANEISG